MGIYKLSTDIKKMAMTLPNVAMASFGDISLYDNKSIILYPYVNIDVVSDNISNNSNSDYILRLYVVDRNEPYVAYNKCELILDELMLKLEVQNYTVTYFTLNFKDQVNGVYTDFNYEENIGLSCQYLEDGYLVSENKFPEDEYIITNNEEKIKVDV